MFSFVCCVSECNLGMYVFLQWFVLCVLFQNAPASPPAGSASGFVFGQNLADRVVGADTTSPSKDDKKPGEQGNISNYHMEIRTFLNLALTGVWRILFLYQ